MQAVIRYPIKFILTDVFFLGLFIFLLQIPLSGSVHATENQDMSTVPVLTEKDSIANIGVYDVTVKNQTSNEITLDFDIVNQSFVQSNIVYTLNLFQKDDTIMSLDQKVYAADVLNFGVGKTLHKEIVYSAPSYLNGTYILEVQIKNTDGLVMGLSQSSEFSLTGNGENVIIDQKSCFLSIDGKTDRYALDQGVDISREETLIAHCSLKSNFPQDISVTPVIETYYRSTSGKIMSTEKQAVMVLTHGKAINFTQKLPKMTHPQSYNAILTFTDDKNISVSPSVDFHYVVQGQGATIQNFSFDKDSYSKGDTAKILLVWTGAAGNFPGARAQSTPIATGSTVKILINDDQKQPCIADFSQQIKIDRTEIKDSFDIPVTSDCKNPTAIVSIAGVDGKTLAQNTYGLESKKSISSQGDSSGIVQKTEQKSFIFLLYGIAFLLIIALLAFLLKKNKTTRMRIFFGLLIGCGVGMSGGYVQAEAYTIPVWYGFNPYEGYVGGIEQSAVNLTVGLDNPRRSYSPGSRMTLSGSSSTAICSNAFGSKLTATVNGVTKVLSDGTFPYAGQSGYWAMNFRRSYIPQSSFVVPSTPGTYNVTFTLSEYVLGNSGSPIPCSVWIQTSPSGSQLCGNIYGTASYAVAIVNIQYTVVAPIPVSGHCGADVNTCTSGSFLDVADDVSKNLWNCNGVGGGSNAPCNTCRISSWGPDTSSQCSGMHFTQTSNCGDEHDAIGTGLGTWTPDPSDVCSSKTVDQTRCSETRRVNGTKVCSTGKWNEIPPTR